MLTYYDHETLDLRWKETRELVDLDSDGWRSWFLENGTRVYAQDRVWEHTQYLLPKGVTVWPWDGNPWNLDYCNLRTTTSRKTPPRLSNANAPRLGGIFWNRGTNRWRVQLPQDFLTNTRRDFYHCLREALDYRNEHQRELDGENKILPVDTGWKEQSSTS